MTTKWTEVSLPADWRPPPEPPTVDQVAYSGLNVYLRRAASRTLDEDLIARDAFLSGARWGYRSGYRACARDTACIGEIVSTMRRLADVLEQEVDV